ncbi:MAG: TonB-dependent receptor [Bacteroidales bacterium]|nr:TonB-dependent receptor [Bacteroidales bacterium]
MRRIIYIFLAITFNIFSNNIIANNPVSTVNGSVTSNGEQVSFATIIVKGTTIGTASDEYGQYNLINIPDGKIIVRAQAIGYKPKEIEVEVITAKSKQINFDLEEDVFGLEQVVITADRNEKNRKESSVIVNTLTPKLFGIAQTATLSEGLNFCPGLRMENNCQNCGFNQVRMNGMEGPYSQILINSRPIFSGLAGVYGLELIPSNMIERIEVVRGGGSALYGSNAIAGTINLILKDPINNSYEVALNSALTGVGINGSGNPAEDYSVNFNTSIVSDENKTGVALYGFYRDRQPFDVNDDGFSELSLIKNNTIGTRLFYRPGYRNKIAIDFFNIREDRRGGNKFDLPKHETDITEAVEHNITTGAITFDQFFREFDLWSVFASGQFVNRDSYYGALQSLKDYGRTSGFTYTIGSQYNAKFKNSGLILGIENRRETLFDEKLGYPDYEGAYYVAGNLFIPHIENTTVADQVSNTLGAFVQYEVDLNKLNISVGARFDNYLVEDRENNATKKTGNVVSPRLTFKYDFMEYLQARVSYSQGYRAPQIFDEDLHIETSGSRKVVHTNDPDLKQETSHSYMASLDFNKSFGTINTSLLIEGFYTKLNDAFANEYNNPDANGVVTYTRINTGDGAFVQGINLELNLVPSDIFSFSGGFTFQSSKYEEEQEFNEKNFFRTPNQYGYLTIDWDFMKNICLSATGNYTGSMLVPYFGPEQTNPEVGELRKSGSFYDISSKLSYDIKIKESKVQIFAGIKNIFNSYQNDFDLGIERDPGYLYGPTLPRTVYFGIKLGNLL